MSEHATGLRALLQGPEVILAPGIYDALTALLADQAGFRCLYLSGASIAYTRLGRPDIGLVAMTEVADIITAVRERVATPVVVDADTGFGNALNVQRTVRLFERAGASAIQLEDQAIPKRCGHLPGKRLVRTAEMVGKVKAACDARRDPATVIVARTDAVAVEGFAAAIERAEAYREAGADVLFIEAPRGLEELQAVTRTFAARVPLLANMVEGGQTPVRSATELAELGFKIVIFPGALVRLLTRVMQDWFADLKDHGTTAAWQDRMHHLTSLNEVIGLSAMSETGRRYDADGPGSVASSSDGEAG